jgi:hypothetical protein
MTTEPINPTSVPAVSRKAIWSLRLVVGSLILFFCPCLLAVLRDWFMELSGVHIHPHSELFSAVLVGCVVVGVLMNVAAVVFGALALHEIRLSGEQIGGSRQATAGIGSAIALLLFVAVAIPGVLTAIEAANRTQCKCNLKQLGLAMHNYHDAFKVYPPAAIRDEAGRPLLSWRVVILPFIEETGLYQKFQLNEPWDSPHNLPLASQMPPQFRCPSDRTSQPNAPNYVIVIGKETYFPPDGQVNVKDVKDGTSLTVMVGEVAGNTVPWTKPDDLVFDQNFTGKGNFSSAHAGGWQVLMGDGTCRFISEKSEPRILRALMTIAGREIVDEDCF